MCKAGEVVGFASRVEAWRLGGVRGAAAGEGWGRGEGSCPGGAREVPGRAGAGIKIGLEIFNSYSLPNFENLIKQVF